jgi:hypothetical protein
MLERLVGRQGHNGPAFLLPFFQAWRSILGNSETHEGHSQGLTEGTDRLYMKVKQM